VHTLEAHSTKGGPPLSGHNLHEKGFN
jgi:hypothetical protein